MSRILIKHLTNLLLDVILPLLPSKAITPLISTSNFYVIKQYSNSKQINQNLIEELLATYEGFLNKYIAN